MGTLRRRHLWRRRVMKPGSLGTRRNRTPNTRMGLALKRENDSPVAGGEGAVNCGGEDL